MTAIDRTYTPALARRVLASHERNGDLITDLTRWACELAVTLPRTVKESQARAYATKYGLTFDEEGWVILPR
jgi:hypothetical protein